MIKISHKYPQSFNLLMINYFQIIYVTRNPKDTCVSLYHYCKLMHDYNGTFEELADLFINDTGN